QRRKEQAKTIFVNSHLRGEAEQICDRVGILRQGDLIREGDVATLTRQRGVFVLGLAPGQAFPGDELTRLGYRAGPNGDFWEVELADGQSIDPVVDLLRARGLSLRHLVEKRESLEELFLKAVQPVPQPAGTRP